MLIKDPDKRINAEELFAYLEFYYGKSIEISGFKIKSIKVIDLERNCILGRMGLYKYNTKVLVADKKKSSFHVLDVVTKQREGLVKNLILQEPKAVLVQNDEIFVGDWDVKQIFVFDLNFDLNRKIGDSMKKPHYLSIDSERNILFVSHTRDNEISTWGIDKGDFLSKIDIDSPRDLKFKDDNLWVLSTNKIILFDKNALNSKIREISLKDLHLPQSLHLSNKCFYTIAYLIDNNGIKSKKNFLFIFDNTNFTVVRKIELTTKISFLSDVIYLNNQIILSGFFESDCDSDVDEEPTSQVCFVEFE